MTLEKHTREDPKGLIFEAYRMENLGDAECRTIFMDWALSLPEDMDQRAAIKVLLDRHATTVDHPMSAVLEAGLEPILSPRRRGGARARRNS